MPYLRHMTSLQHVTVKTSVPNNPFTLKTGQEIEEFLASVSIYRAGSFKRGKIMLKGSSAARRLIEKSVNSDFLINTSLYNFRLLS
jgi:hypothetical protein